MRKQIRGSCLCGGVRFEVDAPFLQANHCHCDRCREHSGTAVCTQTRVSKEQFRLLQGEELIKVYGKGEGAVKAFCVNCGSSLFGGDWPDGPQVSIRMGAFDDDPGIRPQFHTFVDCRAPWDTITDNLPAIFRKTDLKRLNWTDDLVCPTFPILSSLGPRPSGRAATSE